MYEYAIYRGDDFVFMGTIEECAQELNVQTSTILFYCSPAHHKRVQKRNKLNESIIAERIKIDESMMF